MTGAVLALIVRLGGLVGINSQFWAGATIVGLLSLAVAGGGLAWHHQVYQSGYAGALSDIAEENAQAIARAVERRRAWSDCRARDGHWNQSTGGCS
jgi:hypothetical protein